MKMPVAIPEALRMAACAPIPLPGPHLSHLSWHLRRPMEAARKTIKFPYSFHRTGNRGNIMCFFSWILQIVSWVHPMRTMTKKLDHRIPFTRYKPQGVLCGCWLVPTHINRLPFAYFCATPERTHRYNRTNCKVIECISSNHMPRSIALLVTTPTWQFVSHVKSVYVLAWDYLCQLSSLCRFPRFYAEIMCVCWLCMRTLWGCSTSGVV